ncbi:MAG: glutathione S-transferase family protein [Pseudomonadota bacterium]
MTTSYTLYAVEGSYYAAKARCYLIQKDIPFKEVLADRHAFEETILPRVGFPIIPVLISPEDEVFQDTAVMLEMLEQRFSANPILPTDPICAFVSYLVELFADEWFKIAALHYRWHYDAEFAIRMMGENNDPKLPHDEQLRIGGKIAKTFQAWPKNLGVTDITIPAVENSMRRYLQHLDQHFSKHPYLMGAQASLGDCALMGPLYAHLFHDPHSGQMMRRESPNVCDWIARMRETPTMPPTEANFVVSEHVIKLLNTIASDYIPMIADALAVADGYLSGNLPQDKPVPRYLGEHTFTLDRGEPNEASATRSVHTVEIWKLQRLLTKFRSLQSEEQKAINEFAKTIGCQELLILNWRTDISYRDFRFWHTGNT